MAHARQQIREAIAALVTGLATTGATVYQSRVYPIETMPSLSIYTLSERVDETTMDGDQTRTVDLIIEGRAKVSVDLDDTLDTIAAEVETALFADQYLGGTIKSLDLIDTEIEMFDDLEKPAGVMRLAFSVMYRVNQAAPSVLIA